MPGGGCGRDQVAILVFGERCKPPVTRRFSPPDVRGEVFIEATPLPTQHARCLGLCRRAWLLSSGCEKRPDPDLSSCEYSMRIENHGASMCEHMRDLRVAGTHGSPSGFPVCFKSQCQMSKLLPIAAWASRPLLQIHVDFQLPAAGQGRLGARSLLSRGGLGPIACAGAVVMYKPG